MNISLNKLRFNGFRSSDQSSSVDFPDTPVSVIFGLNGSGKTTFLRAINAFLSQNNQYLESIEVESIECKYTYKKSLSEIYEDLEENQKQKIVFDINFFIDNNFIESLGIEIPDKLLEEYNYKLAGEKSTKADWENLRAIIEKPYSREITVRKISEGYDWSSYEASELCRTTSLSLGIERGVTTQNSRVEPELISEFFLHPKFRSYLNSESGKGLHSLANELSSFIRIRQNLSSRHKRSDLDFKSKHANLQNIKLDNIQGILIDHYEAARKMATQKIQNALFDTLAVAIEEDSSDEVQISPDEFFKNLQVSRLRLIEALKGDGSNRFKDTILNKLEGLSEENHYFEVYENMLLRTLFINMMEELRVERLLLNSINLIVDKFNKYLSGGKKLIVTEEKAIVSIGTKELDINELSSGERHILTFLTLVLFHGRNRNFLIIDEPEISLNIVWQRELLGLFNELVPETQIIVASHSPAIAKRNPKYLTELKISSINKSLSDE